MKFKIILVIIVLGGFIIGARAVEAQEITWTQLEDDGFGDINNIRVTYLKVYSGNLLAGTTNEATGTEVWEYNGTTWAQINTDGFGDANNIILYNLVIFNGNLYAGTNNLTTGTEIWEYDGSTWSQVNTDGFGDANNISGNAMHVYDNKLYIGTYNLVTGVEVWEYDGSAWSQVNTDGFGDANNIYSDNFVTYNGNMLYGAANVVTGGQLWEYDGSNWTLLNGDGFGDVDNWESFSFYVDNSILYIGTWSDNDGIEVWTYDGTDFTQINPDAMGDVNNTTLLSIVKYHNILTFGIRNLVTGGEMWTYDGTDWDQVNTDGFGDADNTRAYSLTVLDYKLYTGTANDNTGGQIWVGEIADNTGPTYSNQSPAASAAEVNPSNDISIFIDDATWGVDSNNIDITLAGVNAVVDGVFQAGYSGSITSDGDKGYNVIINPDANLYYDQTVAVVVSASDVIGNATSTTWLFSTMETIPSLGIVVTPASAGGPNVRVVDEIGMQISSFFAYDSSLRMGLEVEQADIDADGVNEIVITPGTGVESRIKAFELDGTLMASTLAFNEGFTGGVNVATGDFNGDYKEDIAVTPIGAGGPNIRIYTYNTTSGEFELLDWFFGYSETFRGGANLAAGDLDANGIDELIVTPRGGMSPQVKVFSYNVVSQKFELADSVIAYQETYYGGVQVATGDINSDGNNDIIVAPFLNGGPNIRVYTLNSDSELELLDWLMAYDISYRGTLSMQVGDTDGDGYNEVVIAPKTLGDSTVKVLRYTTGSLQEVDSFMAYDEKFMGGVNLFVNDVDEDGFDEVMTSPASSGGPNLRVYDYETDAEILKGWFWVFPEGFRGGVNFGK
ncbi:VCBS repeat-containing protein [Patescibacteria group bacterium]|nr:VCBS repeat-containing protein [Patescibacteria group bacterium]